MIKSDNMIQYTVAFHNKPDLVLRLFMRSLLLATILLVCACSSSQSAVSLGRTVNETVSMVANNAAKYDYRSYNFDDVSDRTTVFIYIGYSEVYSTMAAVFKKSPTRMYVYSDVPKEKFDELHDSISMGGYFNSEIRDISDYVRINGYARGFLRIWRNIEISARDYRQ